MIQTCGDTKRRGPSAGCRMRRARHRGLESSRGLNPVGSGSNYIAENKSGGGSKGVLISFCGIAWLSVPKCDVFLSAVGAGGARLPLPPRLLMEAGAPWLVCVFGIFGK